MLIRLFEQCSAFFWYLIKKRYDILEWLRRIAVFVLWIAFLYVSIRAVAITPFNPIAWAAYNNAKWGPVLWNISVPLLVWLLIDKAYPGNTISDIMDTTLPDRDWKDRGVAAFFLLGVLYCLCWMVTST